MNDPTCIADARPLLRTLHLHTPVDAAYLDRVDAQLHAILYARLIAYRQRFLFARQRKALLLLAKGLSVLGLLAALLSVVIEAPSFRPVSLGLVLVFVLLLALLWDTQKLAQRFATPSVRYWSKLARTHTNTMLRQARARAPFDAEYELRGDLAVYFRTGSTRADVAWTRRLRGHRLAADGFTLLFKKPLSLYPYAIFLHVPSGDFDAHLDAVGCRSLGPV
jgi:hypothetical protein